MYYNKFLKYKVKYNEKVKNEIYSSYKNIDKVLNNLDKVYFEVKNVIQRSKPKILTQKGGKMKDYSNNYEKIKKYKKFIKYAKSTIIQYRNMINQYHSAALTLNSRYVRLFNLLKPVRVTTLQPIFFANFAPFIIFLDSPLLLIQITKSFLSA